jgi:hypothetical protein
MALDLSQLYSLRMRWVNKNWIFVLRKSFHTYVIVGIACNYPVYILFCFYLFFSPCLMVHVVRFNMLYMSSNAKNLLVETSSLIVMVLNKPSELYPIVRNNGCERTCTIYITFLRALLVLSTYLIRVHWGSLVSILIVISQSFLNILETRLKSMHLENSPSYAIGNDDMGRIFHWTPQMLWSLNCTYLK